MPYTAAARLLLLFAAILPSAALAAESPAAADIGITRGTAMTIPATPITTRAQLDAYLRDTPPANSPLSWLTSGAQRRFLGSLVFGERGLGGMDLGDLRYELTREQAYTLLQLFGESGYALDLDARSHPRPAADDSAASVLEPAFDRLLAAEQDADGANLAMSRSYATEFAPFQPDAQRHALHDRDVTLLFRATYLTLRRTNQVAYLADLRRDFAELQHRHRVARPHASDFYDALIVFGHADEARGLLTAYPSIERKPPPAMRFAPRVRSSQPSLWIATLGTRKRELVQFRFNIRAPSQVVVLATTGCHFSANAARDIEADPLLRDIFREYGQWVAPPDEVIAFDAVREWNEAHPALRIGIAYNRAALPMVERIETPVFYFLDHGTVVDTVVGWPAGGNLDAIRRGLRKINLMR